MHRFKKGYWMVRAFILSPFFGALRMPSYMGPSLLLLHPRNFFIGRRVRILPGMRAESHHGGKIYIHDNVAIGQSFHITAMGDLHIGEGTVISGFVMVTDIDHEYRDVDRPVLEQEYIHRRTDIGENCFVGMGARLQAGTTLGRGCIVGANAVVRGDFPDHCVIVGAPARIVKRFNADSRVWENC
ncbi:acyltransferase [Nocardioides cavernaquae]|uniref:Acyltransferase n=1 Tax=Nocardioides cavernaquae TaxID=2321396 RepID=A0A3A5HBJ9_9ACTN|nr:acyltransferase [Nocardioides cavernaquae]RJS45404.1 acyltransferase [Nocardioides cavernaquae]